MFAVRHSSGQFCSQGVGGGKGEELFEGWGEHFPVTGGRHGKGAQAKKTRRKGQERWLGDGGERMGEAATLGDKCLEGATSVAWAAGFGFEARKKTHGDQVTSEGAIPAGVEGYEERTSGGERG